MMMWHSMCKYYVMHPHTTWKIQMSVWRWKERKKKELGYDP